MTGFPLGSRSGAGFEAGFTSASEPASGSASGSGSEFESGSGSGFASASGSVFGSGNACEADGSSSILFFDTEAECAKWHDVAWASREHHSSVQRLRCDVVRRGWQSEGAARPYELVLPDVARGLCRVGSRILGW